MGSPLHALPAPYYEDERYCAVAALRCAQEVLTAGMVPDDPHEQTSMENAA